MERNVMWLSFNDWWPFFSLISHANESHHDKTSKITCAQRRLRLAWASTQSSLDVLWVAKDPLLLHADGEDWSDWVDAQAGLIWVFAGLTGHFVGFVMRWLKCRRLVSNPSLLDNGMKTKFSSSAVFRQNTSLKVIQSLRKISWGRGSVSVARR